MKRIINQKNIRILLIAGILLSTILNAYLDNTVVPNREEIIFTERTPMSNPILRKLVYISGGIKQPGVYEIGEDTRVSEVIELAGGISEVADILKIEESINLAKIVTDEEKILIPTKVLATDIGSKSNNLVNLNSASKSQLEELPGVGPVTAERIIENRPFSALEDLKRVKGLTSLKIEQLEPLVSL